MKRELAFVLENQSQLIGSPSRTRGSNVQSREVNGVSEDFSKKRLKNCVGRGSGSGSELDGSIDQAHAGEFRINGCNGASESVQKKRLKISTLKDEPNDVAVECLIEKECATEKVSKCVKPTGEEEPNGEFVQSPIKDGVSMGAIVLFNGKSDAEDVFLEKPVRRFTRSALKPKLEPVEDLVSRRGSGLKAVARNEALMNDDDENRTEAKASRTPKKNLELKMSKKIALNDIPSTVKGLLGTGLLDGLPVTYMAGKKGLRLRGTIKDSGILCSCNLCKGCWVVTPAQFERHACKVYRRAAQYICFENGKSFLQVLKACKNCPLDTLEATIQNAIGSLPVKESTICQSCKGSLPASCAAKSRLLCNSCMKSKKSHVKLTHTIGKESRLPKRALISKSSKHALVSISSKSKSQWKITKKHQRLHKLVFEKGGLPDGTELAYYGHGQKLLEGYKKGSGIFCHCCNCEVSPSLFEAHAGWASRRKPYQYIYTSNGVSLHELAISLSKGRKFAPRDNDDLCIICADGGNLLLCDGCPRAFHKGDFRNVQICQAFLVVTGVDSIKQITKRCIRIVKNPDAEISGCMLCRGHDFHKSGFGPRTVILCDQCEKEFHVGCLKDHKMADLKELPKGMWFCCMDCRRIHSTLQKLLVRGAEKLPDSLSDVIKKKHDEGGLDSVNLDVRWRLLSGKMASPEIRLLLSKAVAIFHNCFDPIVDYTTGRDLIPSMVYGRNMGGQEFGGMYCAILTVNSNIVSTGILRIFGREVAELPLAATSKDNHGKGYFQVLYSCIERLLAFLNVKSFVLPAADEAKSIWTEKFGFTKIPPDQLRNYRKTCFQMMTFKGTSMLQKMVPECRIIRKNVE
ncbi:uncharacterized protein LOC131168662 [Malania oleifera]|uniref:uncharacterized protein LOC131168662 n=1 Tax=Malania oleifera TaxID=397392 RepID=UPI0025AE36CB|nr:uncharacterized protein LOC131168662 [Malania oleifera]